MIERIAILGGSSVYIPEFILSIISHNLNIKEIVLVGRGASKLQTLTRFCQRILDKSGFPATIVGTTSVEDGVANAKYVVNNIRVGGMQARLCDEKLPPKFGMVGDESLGAGGFANAMRTLPVVFEFAETIERVSPDATFINLTNPMGVVVEALTKYSKLKVIGTCDLPGTYAKKVAEVLHHAPSEVWIDYVGLNHMGWIQDVRVNGRSHMGHLLDKLERRKTDGFEHGLIELFRMIPIPTANLYYNQDELVKKQRSCAQFRAEVLHEAEQQILKLYEDDDLCEVPALTHERNAVWYEETIIPVIEALESRKTSNLILCVPNRGSIRDLPDDCSVEIPVCVSRKGLKPHTVGDCPHFLKGLFTSIKESDRLAIEAVRHRSYEYALQSLTINPLVPSLQTAKKYLDRIIKDEGFELH